MKTLELVTLSGIKFSGEVHEALIPTPQGIIGVFADHASLVSQVEPGIISFRKNENDGDDKIESFATNGGIVEITKHRVRLLVDEADSSDEISEKEAKEALKRAQDMAKNAKDQVSLESAQRTIRVQQTRLRVAEIKKRRRRK